RPAPRCRRAFPMQSSRARPSPPRPLRTEAGNRGAALITPFPFSPIHKVLEIIIYSRAYGREGAIRCRALRSRRGYADAAGAAGASTEAAPLSHFLNSFT